MAKDNTTEHGALKSFWEIEVAEMEAALKEDDSSTQMITLGCNRHGNYVQIGDSAQFIHQRKGRNSGTHYGR